MTDVQIIRTEKEFTTALQRIDQLMDAASGSAEKAELELLSLLVGKYEQEHYPIAQPDPVEAILFRMDQEGFSAGDMGLYLGSQSKVSEVLNRKRPLSLTMIRKLHRGLGISVESLINEPSTIPSDKVVQKGDEIDSEKLEVYAT